MKNGIIKTDLAEGREYKVSCTVIHLQPRAQDLWQKYISQRIKAELTEDYSGYIKALDLANKTYSQYIRSKT